MAPLVRLALAGLALLLLAPPASASSCLRHTGPASFLLWDPQDGDMVSAPVEQPDLGGTCHLNNRHDLDGRRLVWLEGPTNGPRELHIREVEWREHQVVAWPPGFVERLSLDGYRLSYSDGKELHTQSLDGSHAQTIPTPTNARLLIVDNGLALYGHGERDDLGLSLYDVVRETWLFRDRLASDFAGRLAIGFAEALNHGFLVFYERDSMARWVLEWETNTARPLRLSAYDHIAGLDGEWLYLITGNHSDRVVERVRLVDGGRELLGRPAVQLPWSATVGGGLIAFGFDATPRTAEAIPPGPRLPELPPPPQLSPVSVPAAALVWVLAGLGAAALLRRAR